MKLLNLFYTVVWAVARAWSQWTRWHTAAVLIPIVPFLMISELTGLRYTSIAIQYAVGWWLLSIADDIYEEDQECLNCSH